VFLPQPGAQPLAGHTAIRGALAQFVALKPTMTADVRKVVQAGDIATVLNTWQLSGTTPDGTPVQMSGTSADVMRRRADGTWGILIDDPWGV
jgi:ketosteroid isomerase-like protein